MRIIQRYSARHPQMHLNGTAITDTTGAEMMYLGDLRFVLCYTYYFLFHFFGQTFLKKFTKSLSYQRPCCFDDKETDDNSSDRVQYRPLATEQDGATYTDSRTYRRKGITTVVPCVSNDSLRVNFSADLYCKSISPFFHHDTDQGGNQGNRTRYRQGFPVQGMKYLKTSVVSYHNTHDHQCDTND